jgi:hypothetical protein
MLNIVYYFTEMWLRKERHNRSYSRFQWEATQNNLNQLEGLYKIHITNKVVDHRRILNITT